MNRIPVIGLEIHVRLATRTKLFCGCENLYGREPNRLTCPVCSGQPGALPVLNAEALRLAVLAGLAFGARIPETITFDRKNYFYPDLPKGYQITQIARPVASGGTVAYRDEKGDIRSVPLIRAHLEEDAGKTIHPPGGDASLVDLNRAGTPLLEIVTEPALTTPEGARRFLKALKRLCLHLGISDCDMEKGSLRCDANVSLRMPGEALPEGKTEIKNLNSFHHVESALRHEIERQGRLLDEGILSARETRSWNETVRRTEVLRTKEELEDYRYFPEPDLPMTALSAEWVSSLEGELPELPLHREDRYRGDLGLTADEAETLVASPDRAAYFEAVIDSGASPREAAKWIRTAALEETGRRGCGMDALRVTPDRLAWIIARVGEGRLSRQAAGRLFTRLAEEGGDPESLMKTLRLEQISDPDRIETLVIGVVAAHPELVKQWLTGKTAAVNALVGRVIAASKGRAHPQRARTRLEAILKTLKGETPE